VTPRITHGDEGSSLIAIRRPTRAETRAGAEIAFVRRYRGRRETILAAVCYESWQQWNAPRDCLTQNVNLVERWRGGALPGFLPRENGDEP
jgi:hypothetical protein